MKFTKILTALLLTLEFCLPQVAGLPKLVLTLKTKAKVLIPRQNLLLALTKNKKVNLSNFCP